MGPQKRKPYERKQLIVIMRPLDPSDPRSLDHPCHQEKWLELARSIGRALAKKELDRLYGPDGLPYLNRSDQPNLPSLLERSTSRT
jgi:hypothetical protein